MAKKYSKKVQETQEKIDEALQSWSDKVRRLGVVPVALGKVRFLCDDEDWLLWEFPSKVLMSL